jgi:hypothetical protein
VRTHIPALAALVLLGVACAKSSESASADTGAGAPAATDTGMANDADRAMGGSGVPSGYTAVTDRPNAKITDAKYTTNEGRWEVQTGPAHVIFAAKDTASGSYGASATFEQLEKPKHREGYGILFGGRNLTNPAQQRYGYFLVSGTGEYLVKVRDGDKTSSVIDWTASPDVPKEDASGKQTYKMTVHVAQDTVHFMVNGKLVGAVPKSRVPTDGIAGLRINHNLHVAATPVVISK